MSLSSLKQLTWNNCANLCNIGTVLQRLTVLMRHRDKHKSVFVHFSFKKIGSNRMYAQKFWYVKHSLRYCDLVYYKWPRHDHSNPPNTSSEITQLNKHSQELHNKHYPAYYPAGKGLFNVSNITKEYMPSRLCSYVIFEICAGFYWFVMSKNSAILFKCIFPQDFFI